MRARVFYRLGWEGFAATDHEPPWESWYTPAELFIQPMSVACAKHKISQATAIGVLDNTLDEEFAQTTAAVFGIDEHIREPAKGARIGHHTRATNLMVIGFCVVHAEYDLRMLPRSADFRGAAVAGLPVFTIQ